LPTFYSVISSGNEAVAAIRAFLTTINTRMTYATNEINEIKDLITDVTDLVDKADGPEAFKQLIDDISSLNNALKSTANMRYREQFKIPVYFILI
jgi:hypothetical protein